MDYRPISLLQTSYKVFAKVLATRLQLSLPRVISDSQQGFVRGRKMSKPVMMMMAQLSTAMEQEEVPAAPSRCILLLNFKKAYDTVDRDFLYATLRQFSFDERFIDLIRRIHTGTTASFVVNGFYSTPLQVRSGIRQGCPLAPLLFLLAVEVLGLALLQDPNLKGLQAPGQPGQTHLYSAFVDDTTLFPETAEQIPHALHVVRAFGALAGLQVQPAKSQLIFLNRSVMLERYEGITVVPTGATTRYLGYEVGTGELVNKNWAQRIRKIQRRLLTATRVATSVENRVLILNSIVLPSLLFTAIVFELPRWAEKELHNLYKQFLWAHATTTESSRHKVNPGLLVTPKQAGGIGLAAVSVAVKTQRTKHAFAWLTQKPDKYYTAWRMWTFRNNQGPAATIVTPAQAKLRASFNREGSPGHELRQELGERLSPTTDQQDQVTAWRHAHSSALLDRAISWWEGDELVLSFIDPFPIRLLGYDDLPEEIQRFWATFNWSANPWIRDQGGNMLARTTYNRIEDCTLEQLHIRRTGPAEFVLRIPIPQDQPGPHSNAKLRRWATAILLSSPDLPIGSELHAAPPLRLRQAPPCLRSFRWKLLGAGLIEGHSTDIKPGQTRPVTLHQADDGLHWFCHGFLPELTVGSPSERQAVCREIRTWGLVFEAHPQLHRFPWSVPTTTSNHFVTKALGKQAFRFHKKVLARQLFVLIDRLSKSATTDEWQCAALRQTPRKVWDHSNGLTPYQVWTGYRVATRQLNLYHATRNENNSCRKAPACSGSEETIGHLFWDCACAAALWGKLIGHWTGQQVTRQATKHFLVACASRRVHSIPEYRMQSLADRFQDDTDAAERVWTRIWHVLATICHTRLWVDRNAAVYKAVPLHLPSSIASFWASCLCQLRAIARREHQKVASATTGALLYACIELIKREPRGPPLSTVTSHDLQSGQPALTSWLRTFQRSCT